MLEVIEHCGVNYVSISREEAILDPFFPKKFRYKLSNNPKASFVILKSVVKKDEDYTFVCEIEQ